MTELDIIRSFLGRFPRSPQQRNAPFTCDAELVQIGGQLWAMSIDEFSPEEDLFSDADAPRLGANLAVATLSDLLAAGAVPAFFLHAVCVPKQAPEAFVAGLADGVAAVLTAAGCHLCGGDVGTAERWRYCGFAMGPVPDSKPLTRVFPPEPVALWVTGQVGDANLAALTGQPTPRFELRLAEARLARSLGVACIDTSGGVLDAVWLLSTANPAARLEIDLAAVPLSPGIAEFAAAQGVPSEAFLLGGAGEYELLFATPVALPAAACRELTAAGVTRIGTAGTGGEAGVHLGRGGQAWRRMTNPPPCPRAAATVEEHVRAVIQAATELLSL